MSGSDLQKLIRYYFKHSFESDAQLRFMQWLLGKEQEKKKEQVMRELCDDTLEAQADVTTFAELGLVHGRIYPPLGHSPDRVPCVPQSSIIEDYMERH